jgi:hypothetical protein
MFYRFLSIVWFVFFDLLKKHKQVSIMIMINILQRTVIQNAAAAALAVTLASVALFFHERNISHKGRVTGSKTISRTRLIITTGYSFIHDSMDYKGSG